MEETIKYCGRIYHWICPWGHGSYFESEDGTHFILTDKEGNVEICSRQATETLNKD